MTVSSGLPVTPVAVPAPVAALAGDLPVTPVWVNLAGGVAFQLGEGEARTFVKWAPTGSGLSLDAEAVRLRWAARYVTVPKVLDAGGNADGAWLVTAGLPGESAVAPRWTADPATAVRAIGVGLRALHDRLPVDDCPFSWSVADRLADAGVDPAAHPELADPPPVDGLVVCHGDPCSPNTLIHPDGSFSAHVDLDRLGVANRWADLAVATWSLEWNYGPGWDALLLDAYGVDPDPVRTAFYRRVWELT
ncbi:kanamycin kinase [Streptacidiphilus sp. BW17]|uniref:phosphotransferase n=1 Tax=Streptacidiphilus sp. BW17 TaxID=3156274 RepID=UPI003511D6EE